MGNAKGVPLKSNFRQFSSSFNWAHDTECKFCRLLLRERFTKDLFENRDWPKAVPALPEEAIGDAELIVVLLFHRFSKGVPIICGVRGNGDALGLDESRLGDSLNSELLLPLLGSTYIH